MNLQSCKHRLVAKLALLLLSSLAISVFNCRDDRATNAVPDTVNVLKAVVGAD